MSGDNVQEVLEYLDLDSVKSQKSRRSNKFINFDMDVARQKGERA